MTYTAIPSGICWKICWNLLENPLENPLFRDDFPIQRQPPSANGYPEGKSHWPAPVVHLTVRRIFRRDAMIRHLFLKSLISSISIETYRNDTQSYRSNMLRVSSWTTPDTAPSFKSHSNQKAPGTSHKRSDVVFTKRKTNRKVGDRLAKLFVELVHNAAVDHDQPDTQ